MPNARHILAPFVPTPSDVVDRMLLLAAISDTDVVYDLGCGDGRVVIAAAKNYGARGVGIDIEPHWVEQSRANAQAAGVSALAQFEHQDALSVDLASATVITLYLVDWSMQLLAPLLLDHAPPGARVVSHNYAFAGWKPAHKEAFTDAQGNPHTLYLWRVGSDARSLPGPV